MTATPSVRACDSRYFTRCSCLPGVNQLDSFASSSGAPGTSSQPSLSSFRTLPAKSNLKRRLTDCMEGDESRSNTDEPVKKKRNIQFDAVTVYYFPRAQGFTCVPSQVSSTLLSHSSREESSLSSLSKRSFSPLKLVRRLTFSVRKCLITILHSPAIYNSCHQ